jgi:exopolysaccharide biosynthesis polyprenyl glycosylphosphotransferase
VVLCSIFLTHWGFIHGLDQFDIFLSHLPPELNIRTLRISWQQIVAYLCIFVLIADRCDLYKKTFLPHHATQVGRLAAILATTGGLYFILQSLLTQSLDWVMLAWILLQIIDAILLIALGRYLLKLVLVHKFNLLPITSIAFAGWSPRLERVIHYIQQKEKTSKSPPPYRILGYFGEQSIAGNDIAKEKGFVSLGKIQSINEVSKNDVTIDLLIVDANSVSSSIMHEIEVACSRYSIGLCIIPRVFDAFMNHLESQVIANVPMLGIGELEIQRYHNRSLRRIIDVTGAIAGLLLSAPIILVMGILIYLESPGPIFYRQTRVGRKGRTFQIIKLRSMKTDAETAGAQWSVENDPRRLKIGRFMREWNLDETPQFWNVLKGEMSLVGPRPERPEFVDTFNMTVKHYNLRHCCKPGMTGWAAVNGLRGNTSLEDRLQYDLNYIENWNFPLDFYIMFRTLLPPKNAY